MRFQLGEPVAQKTNVARGVMEGEEVCRSGAETQVSRQSHSF
jgi:hypothetical protein